MKIEKYTVYEYLFLPEEKKAEVQTGQEHKGPLKIFVESFAKALLYFFIFSVDVKERLELN